MNKKCVVVFSDGKQGLEGDSPIAVLRKQEENSDYTGGDIVDPIFDSRITRNLFGRIMTLVEATTEASRLKAVKDVFSKELRAWETDVYNSAREIAKGESSSSNLYS